MAKKAVCFSIDEEYIMELYRLTKDFELPSMSFLVNRFIRDGILSIKRNRRVSKAWQMRNQCRN